MGEMIIDHPQGYDTIFSNEEDSPAYPYLKQHRAPQSVDDLYELGIIPKSIPRDAIQEARAAGEAANSQYLRITDEAVFASTIKTQRGLVEARLNSQAREAKVQATANHLVSLLRMDRVEAELIASKSHSFSAHDTASQDHAFVYSVRLLDDLIVKSRLIVAPSITIIRARSVKIHSTGEMRMKGKYLLLECDSIYGPGVWQYLSERVAERTNQVSKFRSLSD
jgi:hypothetical protein